MKNLKFVFSMVALFSVLFAFPVSGKSPAKSSAKKTAACLGLNEMGVIVGNPGAPGTAKKRACCEGLKERETLTDCGFQRGGPYHYVCLACGDGKCDPATENSCNCYEDCHK